MSEIHFPLSSTILEVINHEGERARERDAHCTFPNVPIEQLKIVGLQSASHPMQ